MNSQQMILKELARSWEEEDYSSAHENHKTKNHFLPAPKSHQDLIKLSGWYEPKPMVPEKKIKSIKKTYSPFLNDLSKEKIRVNFPEEILSVNSLKPSIVMFGCPNSKEKLQSGYYIDEKEKGRFKIEELSQKRRKGQKIYTKKEQKLKTNSSNMLEFRIREKKTKPSNAQFRSTKNTTYRQTKSHRLQALRIV